MSSPNPIIVECMSLINTGTVDQQKLYGNTDRILEELQKDNMSYPMQIDVLQVGVHKSNRGGYGITGGDCLERGEAINFAGFRFSACKNLVCTEDNPDTRENEQATLELASKDEQLARYVKGQVNYASVAGSHLNGFFAAAKCERPCDVKELSINGKLSPAKICEANPQAKEVFEKGLHWTVVRHKATVLYPGLPEILEQGLNFQNSVHKPENQWQLLNRVMSKVAPLPPNYIYICVYLKGY
jgi:hypothetical protein